MRRAALTGLLANVRRRLPPSSRAFTLFFQLANLTEQVHGHANSNAPAGWRRTPRPARSGSETHPSARDHRRVPAAHGVTPVFHRAPHRASRQTVLMAQRRIADLLDNRSRVIGTLCCESRSPCCWLSDELRPGKPPRRTKQVGRLLPRPARASRSSVRCSLTCPPLSRARRELPPTPPRSGSGSGSAATGTATRRSVRSHRRGAPAAATAHYGSRWA